MKYIKYFLQFIFAIITFIIFKFLGPNLSSNLSGKLFEFIGPFFRSKIIINSNIKKAIPNIQENELNKIKKLMWNNYGRIFAEYIFIKDFREGKLSSNIKVNGKEILDKIVNSNQQVVFVSGHLSNFELMAMYLEKSGVDLATIYRPLNNNFLNPLMERIRNKYICKKQIKKGISGTKEILQNFKSGTSIALMIDQRVSQGIKSNFFNKEALTTTIPAQFVKKFNSKIVPIYIERIKNSNFKLKIYEPLNFDKSDSLEKITLDLNKILEKMIINRPDQWIWTHSRWK